MSRVTSEFWVAAYLARLSGAGVFAHVAFRGEATAGAVLVKVAMMDGRASVMFRSFDADGQRTWATLVDSGPEDQADAAIAKQRGFDRDLWVIEIEDPRGRHLLDEDGLQ